MFKAIKEICVGFYSLLVGMRITITQFFRPTVTVHYPHETPTIPKRFRGHIELVRDPNTGKAICYACKLCERACPSDCITVEGEKLEGAKKKSVTQYRLDFTKCSLCGSCVEACRDGAIRYSHDYNLASLNKDDYVMDLFARLEKESREAGIAPEPGPVNASTPAPAAPAGPAIAATPNPVNNSPRPVEPAPAQPSAPAEVK
jgi:NADH-quinone oxidoreductase subunit I